MGEVNPEGFHNDLSIVSKEEAWDMLKYVGENPPEEGFEFFHRSPLHIMVPSVFTLELIRLAEDLEPTHLEAPEGKQSLRSAVVEICEGVLPGVYDHVSSHVIDGTPLVLSGTQLLALAVVGAIMYSYAPDDMAIDTHHEMVQELLYLGLDRYRAMITGMVKSKQEVQEVN